MSATGNTSAEPPHALPKRKRLRRLRRPLMTCVTAAVWLAAIAGAVYIHGRIRAAGTITGYADDQPVTLAHLEAGIIRLVHVQLHDEVTCGQVLVSMDDHEEQIQLAAIEEDLERLRAEVAAAEARLPAENARAQADVDDLVRRFAVDRENARLEYLSELVVDAHDRILLQGRTVEYETTHDLYARGNAAVLELNEIQTEVEALQANIDQRAELLDRLKDTFDDADQRWARFAAHEEVATAFEPVLAPLRLAVDVRQRDLEEIVRRIDSHVLRSPIDGQVTAVFAQTADRIQAGVPLATISPICTNRVIAYLPEQMILSAQPGTPVTVSRLDALGHEDRAYAGTIVSLSATVTEAPPRYRRIPTYPLWGRGLVVVLNDDVRLVPGEALAVSLSETR